MNNPCPYLAAAQQEKRFKLAVVIEPAIIFVAIIAAFIFLDHLQMRDERSKQADLKKEYQSKCQWHQPQQITEFDCVVVNEKLAVVK